MNNTTESKTSMDLLDILLVVGAKKKRIASVTVAVAVISTLIAFLIPNFYTGTARLVSPNRNSSAAAAMLMAQIGNLASLTGSDFGMKDPSEFYVGMLKSRTIADSIIDKFDLKRRYGVKTYFDAREKLADRTKVAAGKDTIITVNFEDRDPELAAAIANAYATELQKVSENLTSGQAYERRIFFEGQLKDAHSDLAEAEASFKLLQQRTGLIEPEQQTKALVEGNAKLRAQIAATEVELKDALSYATERNLRVIRLRAQLRELNQQLSNVEDASGPGPGKLKLPVAKIPEVALEYLRHYRDVKYYESLVELLSKQYEMARLEEAQDVSSIEILDHAVPPDKKSWPNRGLLIGLSTLFAFLIQVVIAVFWEGERLAQTDPERARKIALIKSQFLRSPLLEIKKEK